MNYDYTPQQQPQPQQQSNLRNSFQAVINNALQPQPLPETAPSGLADPSTQKNGAKGY